MATPIKTPALAARPNWIGTEILLYERQHGPLPNDVVETQGQNLVTQCPTPVLRPFPSDEFRFNDDLDRRLRVLVWHQERRAATYGQEVAEEWPIDRTPPKYKRARKKFHRARMRAEYEADSGSESDITGVIERAYPLSDSRSSSSSPVCYPYPAATNLAVATEPQGADKSVAIDDRLKLGGNTHDERRPEDGPEAGDGFLPSMQEDLKHVNNAPWHRDSIGMPTETSDDAEVMHDANPATRRHTSQRALKLDQHRQGTGCEQEPPTHSVHSLQSPMPKRDPCTSTTQKGKRKRPAAVEDGFALRRSERLRLKHEQLHEEGEGLLHDQAMAGGPAKKRARLITKQAPREGRHGVRQSQRLIRQQETKCRHTTNHSVP